MNHYAAKRKRHDSKAWFVLEGNGYFSCPFFRSSLYYSKLYSLYTSIGKGWILWWARSLTHVSIFWKNKSCWLLTMGTIHQNRTKILSYLCCQYLKKRTSRFFSMAKSSNSNKIFKVCIHFHSFHGYTLLY